MAGNTFIQLPPDITDTVVLRRFLAKLVEQLDIAFGNRGDGAFAKNINIDQIIADLDSRVIVLEDLAVNFGARITSIEAGEPIVVTTTDYISGSATKTIVCKAPSDITVTLPGCILTSGKSKVMSITNTTDTVVTIVPSDSATIVGEASQVLYQYEVLNFICDGTNWELAN